MDSTVESLYIFWQDYLKVRKSCKKSSQFNTCIQHYVFIFLHTIFRWFLLIFLKYDSWQPAMALLTALIRPTKTAHRVCLTHMCCNGNKSLVHRTFWVRALTSDGATIPGIVANMLLIPYISPEYLQKSESHTLILTAICKDKLNFEIIHNSLHVQLTWYIGFSKNLICRYHLWSKPISAK